VSRRLQSAAAVVLLALVAGSALSACGRGASSPKTAGVVADGPGRAFLDRYADPDGRVVRRDQGGDTVSEGQAYALVVAEKLGDEGRFTAVWNWTRAHLERPDGLLAWHWADGRVADDNPAADADVDAAGALLAAARRFSRPALRTDGLRLAGAVLAHETAEVGGRLVLLPGPWAAADHVVNPSYFAPCTWLPLAAATGDRRWKRLMSDAGGIIGDLDQGGRLPPDWARIGPDGRPAPAAAPGSGVGPRYGLDAVRLPARLAAPCPAGTDTPKKLAAALWPALQHLADGGAGLAYGLDGSPIDTAEHPAGLVAAASAARAAGDDRAASELLSRAIDLDRRLPTYYGAAWLALESLDRNGSAGAASPPPPDRRSSGTPVVPQERRTAAVAAVPLQLIASRDQAGDSTTTTPPSSTTGAPPASTTTSTTTTAPPTSTTDPSAATTATRGSDPTTRTTTAAGAGASTPPTTGSGSSPSPRQADQPLPPQAPADPAGTPSAGAAAPPAPAPKPPAAARLRGGLLLAGLGLAVGAGLFLGLHDRMRSVST
jgi:endoglucanase